MLYIIDLASIIDIMYKKCKTSITVLYILKKNATHIFKNYIYIYIYIEINLWNTTTYSKVMIL